MAGKVPPPPAKKGRAKFACLPITPERERIFLTELAASGSVMMASRKAGASKAKTAGLQTWVDHANRNPEFKARMDAALEQAIGSAERELRRRAIDGTERPVVSAGKVVATFTERSDNLLLHYLRVHHPEKWNIDKNVNVKGSLTHNVQGFILQPGDLLALDDTQRSQLEAILETISNARGEPAIDAEWSDAEPVPALPAPEQS
jgi:hypothetical protein